MVRSLLVAAALLFVCAFCLHEDEQGKWDWAREGLGITIEATFSQKSKTNKLAFVASNTGVIAALRTRLNGELKWRRVYSKNDTIVCLAANGKNVVAGTKNGLILLLNVADGTEENSVMLGSKELLACSIDDRDNVIAVGLDEDNVPQLFVLNDFDKVEPKPLADISGHITKAKCSAVVCWIQTSEKLFSVAAMSKKLASHTEARGAQLVSAAGFSALIVDGSSKKAHVLESEGEKITQITEQLCEGSEPCGFALVESDAAGKAPEIAVVTYKSKTAVTVRFNAASPFTAEVAHRQGRPVSVHCARSGKKNEMLLTTADGHLHYLLNGETAWDRPEGLSAAAFAKIGETAALSATNNFGFSQLIFVQSRLGRLYCLTTVNGTVEWSVDTIADAAAQYAQIVPHLDELPKYVWLSYENEVVTTIFKFKNIGLELHYSAEGVLRSSELHPSFAFSAGHVAITEEMKTLHTLQRLHNYYRVDKSKGFLQGYNVMADSDEVVPTWKVQLKGAIVAFATGSDHLAASSAYGLRSFPNITTKINEVRRKYPTVNMIVTAHYQQEGLLVITAIDSITGSILGMTSHGGVEGSVKIIIVEHVVIYHFLNTDKMRFCLGVWELFLQDGTVVSEATMVTPGQIISSFLFNSQKMFSSFDGDKPVIAPIVLGFPGGELAALGTTTSFGAIARKMVLFSMASGRVYAIELSRLLLGGLGHPQKPDMQLTNVVVPSTQIVSHKHMIYNAEFIVTAPTQLESSCHVLVVGQDLFYIRLSSGKQFDMLNDDFNHERLVLVVLVLAGIAIVFKYLSQQRTLDLEWK